MYGVAWTLDKVYSRIKSGKFRSANTDDYFDLVAWHPYVFTNRDVLDADLFLDVDEPDQLWKSYNDAAYKVMKKYGDGHKQVLLTESGFTDCGNPEWEGIYLIYFSRSPADTSKGLRLFSKASQTLRQTAQNQA